MPTQSSPLPWVLFANSGIQFIDGLLTLPRSSSTSAFIRTQAQGPISEVLANEVGEYYFSADGTQPQEWVRPEYNFSLEDSINQMKNAWLPLPFLTLTRSELLTPTNWVRGFIAPHPSRKEHWRITLAIDTTLCESDSHSQPMQFDTQQGQSYALCQDPLIIRKFMTLNWVSDWLAEVWKKNRHLAASTLSSHPSFIWQAHYLNLLKWLTLHYHDQRIELRSAETLADFIATDAIIDLGNSNSCCVLYEPDTNGNDPLATCSEISLRDLSAPNLERSTLFSSEVNFSPNPFGDPGRSAASGRLDAFQWGSPVRIGAEAERLNCASAQLQRLQGVTSPRRYLWDDAPSVHTWYNSSSTQLASQAAMDQLFSLQLNDAGELLSQLPLEQRIPLFKPVFRRSSLLMQMLTELFCQVLSQLNSLQHRQKLVIPLAPRYLRRVIFTLPVNFTRLERARFTTIAEQALELLRSTQPLLRQHQFHLPEIVVPWDEACCSQIFWLWQTIKQSSVAALVKKYSQLPHKQSLRIALIDIGGGTTDLAITDYHLHCAAQDHYQTLAPQIYLRQGFSIAGDSLSQDIINKYLLPQIAACMQANGYQSAPTALKYLFGTEGSREGDTPWRQFFVRHLLLPVVHDLLARYRLSEDDYFCRVQQLIGSSTMQWLSQQLMNKLRNLDERCPAIDFSAITFKINFSDFDSYLRSPACRLASLLNTICDTVTRERCDILLLSGQVVSLSSLQQLLAERSASVSYRIILLAEMTTHGSLPFCHQGKLINGKYATALGGLLYSLIEQQRMPEQGILAGDIASVTPQRWFGKLNEQGYIQQVLFDSPSEGSQLTWVTINGSASLGYRCSCDENVIASPLFSIRPDREKIENLALGVKVLLEWHFDARGEIETLPTLLEVRDSQAEFLANDVITLTVNTLSNRGLTSEAYWRDDGRVGLFYDREREADRP